MGEREALLAVTAQRDKLAQYIHENDGGDLDSTHCRGEVAAGRCPFRNLPYDESRTAEICVPCIVNMIAGGTHDATQSYFLELAKYHILVACHVIGGAYFTARVISAEGGLITFLSHEKKRIEYHINQIDTLVPKEVLRWSGYKIETVRWH